MTVSISGTDGVTFNDSSVQTTAAKVGMVNRIINGQMVLDQRNAGASVSVTDSNQYTLDRWQGVASIASSKFTAQQSSTAATGFGYSLLATSSSAYSVLSGDYFLIRQKVEGFNTADLNWGTASAATVTLSFWVRSSLTGTFGGAITNSANSYSYPFTYTISTANTFEQKTITIAGPTAGTWIGATNGIGLQVNFGLGVGSTYNGTAGAWAAATYLSATGATSVVGTNGATFYITGVQLEKGSTATSFDYRPYGTELALCQRYYFKFSVSGAGIKFGIASNATTTKAYAVTNFLVPMRAAPSALEQSGTAGDYTVLTQNSTVTCSSVPVFSVASTVNAETDLTFSSGLTAGNVSLFRAANSSAYLAWSTEL